MTDLTVLVSPMPLYPQTTGFTFGRRQSRVVSHPMVTLERVIDPEVEADGYVSENDRRRDPTAEWIDAQSSRPSSPSSPSFAPSPGLGIQTAPSTPPRRSRSPTVYDKGLLSPPPNTWKSPSFAQQQHQPQPQHSHHRQHRQEDHARPRPKHRSTRSRSAPPGRTELELEKEKARVLEERENALAQSQLQEKENLPNGIQLTYNVLPLPRLQPRRSIGSVGNTTTFRGEPIRPPPPLFRPTTFWRKTSRSGVTSASFSPSAHLIRRSTFIAAGLQLDAPVHDLSSNSVKKRGYMRVYIVSVGVAMDVNGVQAIGDMRGGSDGEDVMKAIDDYMRQKKRGLVSLEALETTQELSRNDTHPNSFIHNYVRRSSKYTPPFYLRRRTGTLPLSILLFLIPRAKGQALHSQGQPTCPGITMTVTTTITLLFPNSLLPSTTQAPYFSPTTSNPNLHVDLYPYPTHHPNPPTYQAHLPRNPIPQQNQQQPQQIITITVDPFSADPSETPTFVLITETIVDGSLVQPGSGVASPSSPSPSSSFFSGPSSEPTSRSFTSASASASFRSTPSSLPSSSSTTSTPTAHPPSSLLDTKHFTIHSIYFVILVSVVGAILISALLWLAYGCMHRKPKLRVRSEEEEGFAGMGADMGVGGARVGGVGTLSRRRGLGIVGSGRDGAGWMDHLDEREEMKRRRGVTGEDRLVAGPEYSGVRGDEGGHEDTESDEESEDEGDWMRGNYGYHNRGGGYYTQPYRGWGFDYDEEDRKGRRSKQKRREGVVVWPGIAKPPPMEGDILPLDSRSRSHSRSRSGKRYNYEDPFSSPYDSRGGYVHSDGDRRSRPYIPGLPQALESQSGRSRSRHGRTKSSASSNKGKANAEYRYKTPTRFPGPSSKSRPEPGRNESSLAMLQSYWSDSDSEEYASAKRMADKAKERDRAASRGPSVRLVGKKKSWMDSVRGTASAILNSVTGASGGESTGVGASASANGQVDPLEQRTYGKRGGGGVEDMMSTPTGIAIPTSVEELEEWLGGEANKSGGIGGLVIRKASRKSHRRNDSDVRVDERGTSEARSRSRDKGRNRGYLAARGDTPTPKPSKRHHSTSHSRDNRDSARPSSYLTEMVITTSLDSAAEPTARTSGRGFRIITESPSPTLAHVHAHANTFPTSRSQRSSGFASSMSVKERMRELMKDDGYTALPERGSRFRSRDGSRSRSTSRNYQRDHQTSRQNQSTSTTSPSGDGKRSKGRGRAGPTVDLGVLPQSPTQIMSPPLNEILTFSPNPMSFASLAELEATTPSGSKSAAAASKNTPATPSRSSKKGKGRQRDHVLSTSQEHYVIPSKPLLSAAPGKNSSTPTATPHRSRAKGHPITTKLTKKQQANEHNTVSTSPISPLLPSPSGHKVKVKPKTQNRHNSSAPTPKSKSSKSTAMPAGSAESSLRLPLPLPLPLAKLASDFSSGSEYTTASAYDPARHNRNHNYKGSKASAQMPDPKRKETKKDDGDQEALKRVHEIMATSWSVRDVGEEEMRSLSPTGFGRRI
ncbi:hypothetical protein AX16_007498 [Volvariella volvacea WC 439]|nr:hypothetical protein AX16_007498 [Volvariella volvacea WC 439]